SPNLAAQQKRFDRWRHEYNHDRPHEAIDMLRPAEIYRPSARRLGEKDKMRYPPGYHVCRVSGSGHVSFMGSNFYLSEIYSGCRVGLFENDRGIIELHYANLHLGNLEFDANEIWRPKTLIISANKEPRATRPK
ncbi:MAG: hypothetical protein AAGJ81_12660, partial [Verrucomicrobiota bacterium]